MTTIELGGRSADELEALAAKAKTLAADLRGNEPSYLLAIAHGVEDRSYSTVRWGWVNSYRGEAEITMADGSRWRAIGHVSRGDAEHVSANGYIEFVPLDQASGGGDEPSDAAIAAFAAGLSPVE